MTTHSSVSLLALLTCMSAACSQAASTLGSTDQSIVYGTDDRVEYFELGDAKLRERVSSSVVAFIPVTQLVTGKHGLEVRAPSYGESQHLCENERFREQPAAAFCTGVLVDDDLVLTAGHCVRVLGLHAFVAVFGFYYRAPGELAISPNDVYEPSEIVAEALDPPGTPGGLDYAFVRLRHAVESPRAPVAIGRLPEALADMSIDFIGAGGGVPLKIDSGGKAQPPGSGEAADFFANVDAAHGASGGGAFDARGALVGILARGGNDFVTTKDGCQRSFDVEANAAGMEAFSSAQRALEGLCEQANDASSLCRRACGDPCAALPPQTPASCAVVGGKTARSPAFWVGACLALTVVLSRRIKRTNRQARADFWG